VDDQEVIRLYRAEGLTLAQVAARCKVSHSEVVRVLDRHGVARRPAGPRPRLGAGQEQAERQILEQYARGMSLRQAGASVGVGPRVVTAVLERHGVARRRPGRSRRAVPAGALAASGDSDRFLAAREVATLLKVSRSTVYRLIGSGALEATRVSVRGLRVRESALRAYLRDGEPLPGSGEDADAGPYVRVGVVVLALAGEVMTVGRGAGCDIRLDDPSVAVRHARLARRGRQVTLTSLAAPGSTRVNGRAVTRRVLADGDVISFGEVTCTAGGITSGTASPAGQEAEQAR
jgi:excisionase family DNA binding protein